MRKIISLALILTPFVANAAPQDYAVACATSCAEQTYDTSGASTMTQAPAGWVDNMIVLDPDVAHGFAAPAGHVLIPVQAGEPQSGTVATAAQLASGLSVIP